MNIAKLPDLLRWAKATRRAGDDLILGGQFYRLYSAVRHCPACRGVLDGESAMETELSPRCPKCGQTLRRMRLISDLYRLPDLRVFECADCDMSLIEGAEDLE
jgi:hypothetical protein